MPASLLRLASVAAALALTNACGLERSTVGTQDPTETVETVSGAEPHPSGPTVTVTLWHCGVEPITVDDRVWEVPASETVDGDPMLPLDATNTPDDWVGRGTATVDDDELTYVDEGGEVVGFVPDDGVPAGPCG